MPILIIQALFLGLLSKASEGRYIARLLPEIFVKFCCLTADISRKRRRGMRTSVVILR
jgi:hypothetical protein